MEGEPEAQQALDLIRDVYLVEHAAKERDIVGSAEHRALRQAKSAPLMAKLKAWPRRINLAPARASTAGRLRSYPIGKKISTKELRELNIEQAEFHGNWNYLVRPRPLPSR